MKKQHKKREIRPAYTVARLELKTGLTATAIANEWIFALASTTLELMKPPYDYNSKSTKSHESINECGEKRHKGARREPQMNPGRLTQPQIPIRFGSTYGFLAQALRKIISWRFGKRNRFKSQESGKRKTNQVAVCNQHV